MALDEKGLMSLVVGHRVGIERLSKRVVQDVIKLLEAVDADIAAQIAADFTLGLSPPERTQRLRHALRGVLAEAHKAFRGELTSHLTDAAAYEVDWSQKLYEGLDVAFDFVTPSRHQLRSLVTSRPFQGAVLREWARGLEADSLVKLMQQLRIGMLEGENLDSIIRRTTTVLPQKRRHAEAMVRTAINHVSNAAHQEFGRENRHLFDKARWISVLDSRTSPVCRARAGKIYPIDSGPRPPAHWQCRSTIVLLPIGTEFRSEPHYDEWLSEQPTGVIDDILGPSRGRLFRHGQLSTTRMVDRFGRALTLREFRARDAAAFQRAGLSGF